MSSRKFTMGRFGVAAALIWAGVLLLICCPNPLDLQMIRHVKDSLGPVITVLSPAEGSSYAAMVVVTGTVRDEATAAGDPGALESLRYEVLGTAMAGDITINPDGQFTFQFATTNFSGTVVVRLTATDWNGNSVSVSLTLVDQGAIPSFEASAGNHEVTLTWQPPLLATGYTLYYTTNGALPSESYGIRVDNVTSPHTVTGLANGALHRFVLQAHSSEGDDNWSVPVDAIPLSPRTLSPRVVGEYGRIVLEWNSIPASDIFEVFRSELRDGPYLNISGPIHGNRFVDALIEKGVQYFYQVRLSQADAMASIPGCAEAGALPYRSERAIGSYPCPYSYDLVLSGTTVFVNSGGWKILDVSNPRSPICIGQLQVSSYPLSVGGDIGVVPGYILDLHDLRAPSVAYHSEDLGYQAVVSPSGDFAYYVNSLSSFRALDLSSPSSPQWGASCELPPGFYGMALAGDLVLVADGAIGLQIVDVSNPASPHVEGTWTSAEAVQVAVSGTRAYVLDEASQLHILDISSPSAPVELGSLALPSASSVWDLAAVGKMLFVADRNEGLKIYDMTDPAVPKPLCFFRPTSGTTAVAANGTHAFICSEYSDLQVLDLAIPSSPAPCGSCSVTPGWFRNCGDVSMHDHIVYSSWGANGVRVFDVSSPDSPLLLTEISTTGSSTAVATDGTNLYVADQYLGLEVFDVVDPSHPVQIATVPGSSAGVTLFGDYALVADLGLGLRVIDVSDPAAPRVVGLIAGGASRIAVKGNYAFVGAFAEGLKIVDLTTPSDPRLIATCDTPGQVCGVEVSGNYAYVADMDGGLKIIDISFPAAPRNAGSFATTGSAWEVVVSGGYAFVFEDTAGLRILDVSTPDAPFEVGSLYSSLTSATISGRYLYYGPDTGSFSVLDLIPGR